MSFERMIVLKLHIVAVFPIQRERLLHNLIMAKWNELLPNVVKDMNDGTFKNMPLLIWMLKFLLR